MMSLDSTIYSHGPIVFSQDVVFDKDVTFEKDVFVKGTMKTLITETIDRVVIKEVPGNKEAYELVEKLRKKIEDLEGELGYLYHRIDRIHDLACEFGDEDESED